MSQIPIYYEMGVESAYPVAESLTTCALTSVNNIWVFVFLLVPMIPNIGTAWMNWSVAGGCIFALLFILPFSSRYGRFAEDEEHNNSAPSGTDEKRVQVRRALLES